jgi:acyl-coenzyme A thioesterase PaaI-like protein
MTERDLLAAGWEKLATREFSAKLGTMWRRGEKGVREIALLTSDDIANDFRGMVHGGALMTFADLALGIAAGEAVGHPMMATAQLQYHFTGAVPFGVLLTCEPELVRKTSQLAFVRGLFKVGETNVGMADAMFKILDAAKMEAIAAKSR